MQQTRTTTHTCPPQPDLEALLQTKRSNLPVLHREAAASKPCVDLTVAGRAMATLPVPWRQVSANVLAAQTVPTPRRFDIAGGKGAVSVHYRTANVEARASRGFPLQAATGKWATVATLKQLVGRPGESVLMRHKRGWRPVGDTYLVDLTDRSVEFLIGPIAIFS